jgi:hypothetical protein
LGSNRTQHTVESETVESETVESETVESETVESETVELLLLLLLLETVWIYGSTGASRYQLHRAWSDSPALVFALELNLVVNGSKCREYLCDKTAVSTCATRL